MIKIGFDNDIIPPEDMEEDIEQRQGDTFDLPKRRDVYISPERLEAIKKEYDCVVVHDFGDEYHLSEEEREAKNKYYSTFKALRKAKKKYRRLNEYVQVMRDALKCLDAVAENNGIYDPDEFKLLFLKGEIYINGLKFPKYKGRDRKDISWEYLSEFILSDKDPDELLPKKNQDILNEEEMDDMKNRLFTEEELSKIMRPLTELELQNENKFFDVDEDSQDNRNVAVYVDNKSTKKFMKNVPEFLGEIKDIKRSMSSAEHIRSFAYDLTMDDIERIEKYDQKHNYSVSSEMPVFKGDIMNDNDYNRYMMELQEYEDENIKENYNGRMKSLSEIRELELKALLEENGWNIRALYNNKEKEEKLRKAMKRDKRREKELKEQLIKIQKRNQKRRIGDDEVAMSKKKKKKKKKNKKDEYD